MDRRALLLYLQNIRDLEVAKEKLGNFWSQKKNRFMRQINDCQTEPRPKPIPEFTGGIGCLGVILATLAIMGIFVTVSWFFLTFSGDLRGEGTGAVLLLGIVGTLVFGIPALHMKKDNTEMKQKYDQEIADIQKYNERQPEVAKQGRERKTKLENAWNHLDNEIKKEYYAVDNVLQSFYSMNIIPVQFRNLPAAIYIFDYMSTSQQSLTDALFSNQIKQGIEEIKESLGQILSQLDDLVYETRCLRSENRSGIQHTISQNDQMLRQLQSVSSSSAEAAEYARLASNYSKANAFFSYANYLK